MVLRFHFQWYPIHKSLLSLVFRIPLCIKQNTHHYTQTVQHHLFQSLTCFYTQQNIPYLDFVLGNWSSCLMTQIFLVLLHFAVHSKTPTLEDKSRCAKRVVGVTPRVFDVHLFNSTWRIVNNLVSTLVNELKGRIRANTRVTT